MHLRPPHWRRLLSILKGGTVVVDSLFIVTPIVCGGLFCYVVLNVLSNEFCNQLDEEERAGCFTLIVLVCNCGIS